jgi:hypothetical protein
MLASLKLSLLDPKLRVEAIPSMLYRSLARKRSRNDNSQLRNLYRELKMHCSPVEQPLALEQALSDLVRLALRRMVGVALQVTPSSHQNINSGRLPSSNRCNAVRV